MKPADQLGWEHFAAALRKRESGGDYLVVNSYGFMGAYQFGMERLCDLGYTARVSEGWRPECFEWKGAWTRDRFLADSDEQDNAFARHMNAWAGYLLKRTWATDHLGQPLAAYAEGAEGELTLSGMLGVCHLKGPGGLRKLLQGQDNADGYGTKASEYMVLCNGYF